MTMSAHLELTGRTLQVRYDDDDPTRVLDERPAEPVAANAGPVDGLMGAGFVELRLSRLLA